MHWFSVLSRSNKVISKTVAKPTTRGESAFDRRAWWRIFDQQWKAALSPGGMHGVPYTDAPHGALDRCGARQGRQPVLGPCDPRHGYRSRRWNKPGTGEGKRISERSSMGPGAATILPS